MQEAIQTYLNSYRRICPQLKSEELAFIGDNVRVSSLKRREFYLQEGEIQRSMGFVYKGLLRSYYINRKGEEVTIGFIAENMYASDYPSFIQQQASNYFIKSLEPSIIVNLPHTAIQEAYAEYKNFEQYGRLIAEAILIQKEVRIRSFLFQSAEERYLDFLEKNQHLEGRISLTYLSSFLGIQRQSLSRIRKKMMERKRANDIV